MMKKISRIFPYPILTVGLVLIWLALYKVSYWQILIALILTFFLQLVLKKLEVPSIKIKSWRKLFILSLKVFLDTIESNIYFLLNLLTLSFLRHPSGFVRIKLKIHDRRSLYVFSFILSISPGTIWVAYDKKLNELLLHIFTLPSNKRNKIRQRLNTYQKMIKEVFHE